MMMKIKQMGLTAVLLLGDFFEKNYQQVEFFTGNKNPAQGRIGFFGGSCL